MAALAPKIEALEASWNRLRAISGGVTPEEVVRYWDGEKLGCPGAALGGMTAHDMLRVEDAPRPSLAQAGSLAVASIVPCSRCPSKNKAAPCPADCPVAAPRRAQASSPRSSR